MREESDLIRAAAGGDAEAFEELVLRKRERVVRTAYRITGDWEDARDVSQWVFVRLWRTMWRFDEARRFDTWLYRITVNLAIDLLREKGTRGILVALPDDAPDPQEGPGADRAVDTARLERAFLLLASRLAPKQRAAFVLKEIEGLDTSEVARVLGVRESTVRNHLLQARRVLRRGLENEFPGLLPGTRGPGPGDGGR